MRTGASGRTQTLVAERTHGHALAGDARRAAAVVRLDLAAQAAEAGLTEALVTVDAIETRGVVVARTTRALVYVGLTQLALKCDKNNNY